MNRYYHNINLIVGRGYDTSFEELLRIEGISIYIFVKQERHCER